MAAEACRISIRRQAHHFVFFREAEADHGYDAIVQDAERLCVRIRGQELVLRAAPERDTAAEPVARTVDRDDQAFAEARVRIGADRMGKVMIHEAEFAIVEPFPDSVPDEVMNELPKCCDGLGIASSVKHVAHPAIARVLATVVHEFVDVVQRRRTRVETKPDRVDGALTGMLDAGQALFFDRRNDATVFREHRSGIVAATQRKEIVSPLGYQIESTAQPQGQHATFSDLRQRR